RESERREAVRLRASGRRRLHLAARGANRIRRSDPAAGPTCARAHGKLDRDRLAALPTCGRAHGNLDREVLAAPAFGLHLRVHELEALLLEGVDEVERGAGE